MTSIKKFAADRGIKSLFHFTRVANLNSILRRGLLPRNAIPPGAKAIFNDDIRLDGTDAVCASISFPNYKLFYPFRQKDPQVDWVVIALSAALLWESRCAFCTANAASNTVTTVPIEGRMDLPALKAMFGDFAGKIRSDLQIPDGYPTNPQAEVLLLDGAPVKYINEVVFATDSQKKKFQAAHSGLPTRLNGGYFVPRSDFKHWK